MPLKRAAITSSAPRNRVKQSQRLSPRGALANSRLPGNTFKSQLREALPERAIVAPDEASEAATVAATVEDDAEKELRDRYPNLSKLALDVLSIPALSCECERLFSELGDLLEPRRRAIKPQLLAAIQCVRRWQRAGLGDVEVATKGVITDDEMELLYDFKSWGGDYHNS
ncbi:Dimer-Tnp-hAT domain containing protein [Pyrenophora tritici-repentis]|uniref:Dimer-Tnp-hAT dimerization containing protein n=1 Tax=Pyrenophora tritici-repentis TaxID=45151 RepID=A0A317AMC1_9PLEO|nr:Dimer-Tnp-hAT domain containing protein [Pyrenophora tritici-repentis]KAI1511006.1 Dimer-Tnp-hAT dimerization containing protein [Pyrenophora tritici-repentis]KAI1681013.1 Dimer-Tnp-hAT dimerization containing protein [Pyrenophora tritici-repentis]